MSLQAQVSHGVESKRDIEAMLIRLTCGGFDPDAGSNTGDDNLRDASRLQLALPGPCS